jgi:RNA polymerase sigma-70 factor (ECF subfamily)
LKSDETLLGEIGKGREESLVELYGRHQRDLFRFAWHMTGSRELAEEAVQEAFLAILRQPDAYRAEKGAPRSFLFGVTRNQVPKRLTEHREFEELAIDAPGEEDLLSGLTASERVTAVREAVWALPMAYREAVVLCEMEEASYEEAARVLACPVGTVRSRLSRGKALLAAKLKAQFAGKLV